MPDRKTEKERYRKKKEDDGSQDESKLIHAPNYAWVIACGHPLIVILLESTIGMAENAPERWRTRMIFARRIRKGFVGTAVGIASMRHIKSLVESERY
jgi:hypothetical protein